MLLWSAKNMYIHVHVAKKLLDASKKEWRQVNVFELKRDCRKSTGNKLRYWYA